MPKKYAKVCCSQVIMIWVTDDTFAHIFFPLAPSASYLDLTCQLFLQAKYLHFLNVFLDKDSDDEAIASAGLLLWHSIGMQRPWGTRS